VPPLEREPDVMPSQTTQDGAARPPLRTGPHPDVRVSSRGTLALLAVATAVGSLGLAAGGTAGGLLATELTGSAATAGLPLGALVAGSAAGALIISNLASRAGRAAGLVLGYTVGAVGAAVVITAAAAGSLALVLVGNAALGAANAAVFLTRYAAADVGGSTARGRTLSTVMFAASVGAVAGPNLLHPSGELAGAMGLPPVTGLYLVAVPSFAVAGVLLTALARSAGHQLGRRAVTTVRGTDTAGRLAAALGARPVRTALLLLGAVNFVMVGTMAIAPVHLAAHGHGLEVVGLVISVHVTAMFVPSPLSGWAADRAGGGAVALLGAAVLVAAGVTGTLARPASCAALTIALALLGLGWNAGVVGASTLLAASVPPALRTRVEGVGEIAMGLAAAAGAPLAGLVTAAGGFTAVSILTATVATLVLASVALHPPRHAPAHEPRSETRPAGVRSRPGVRRFVPGARAARRDLTARRQPRRPRRRAHRLRARPARPGEPHPAQVPLPLRRGPARLRPHLRADRRSPRPHRPARVTPCLRRKP
jgi:MFS family permease